MSITKIKNTKKYRVRVSFMEDGKQKHIERTAHSYSEAKELEAELQTKINEPTQNKMTVSELRAVYLENKKSEVRASSLLVTKRTIITHIEPYLGDKKLTELTVKNLQKWKTTINNLELSLTMNKNIYKTFNAMLNYAIKMEYLPSNNLKKIGNFKDVELKEAVEKVKFYTPDEFLKYISVLKNDCETIMEWTYYVFFNFAFFTGMRKGEIYAIRWCDVEGQFIEINKSLNKQLKIETAPKNKSSIRTLQLPVPLIEVLDEHKKRVKSADMFDTNSYIFDKINNCTLEQYNKTNSIKAGLHKIRIHDFRHTHASLLINHDINIMEIARRLGHSNVEMTWNVYGHLYPQTEEQALEVLNKIIP